MDLGAFAVRSPSRGALGELIHRFRIEFGGSLENPAHRAELVLREGDSKHRASTTDNLAVGDELERNRPV